MKQHELISVCCVCGAEIGRKPCIPEMDGKLSHGYCQRCLFVELVKMGAEKINLAPVEVVRICKIDVDNFVRI
ncbi:hypothetical protein M0R72_13855 [Candidatus Pacearchaeota archaeon]|nr:hypothetical protein [Candidatus Pacearchaeota archaeon]